MGCSPNRVLLRVTEDLPGPSAQRIVKGPYPTSVEMPGASVFWLDDHLRSSALLTKMIIERSRSRLPRVEHEIHNYLELRLSAVSLTCLKNKKPVDLLLDDGTAGDLDPTLIK
jgi:hypothetical protein